MRQNTVRRTYLILLSAFAAVVMSATSSIVQAQSDPPTPTVPTVAALATADDAAEHYAPVDPSVFVDAFQTLVDPGGQTADSIAEAAVESAPQIEAQRAAMRSAAHQRDRQWLNVMPQVGLSFGYTRLSEVEQPVFGGAELPPGFVDGVNGGIAAQRNGDPVNEASADIDAAFLAAFQATADGSSFSFPQVLNQWSLQGTLSYPVTDLFLTILPSYRAFEGFADAERLQLDAVQANIDLRARETYYGHVRAQARLAVALAAQRQTEANREQVAALVDAGVLPRVNVIRVDAQHAEAGVGVARARGAVLFTAHTVRTLMHAPPGQGPIAIGENLAASLPEVTESRAELITQALESRSEMLALRRLVGAHEDLVSVHGGSRWPRIIAHASAEYANPNNRIFPQSEVWKGSWAIGAMVQYTLNQSFEGDQERSRAQAQADKTRADMNSLRDAITISVDQAYESFNASKSALIAAGAGLQAAEEAYRVRQEELQAGIAIARDLVDAESDLTRARINLVDSIINLHVSHAQLRRAVGR
ncbi:MAG: TolC family protein [Deltaproteobacteria bacterium]|nr:TolC family protein [Deltaproteobacteria bacterium]